ncbi:MAG: hypothetical protein ACI9G1_000927 [Pirellulaceae bacterium]|jgi:hypothetical protein
MVAYNSYFGRTMNNEREQATDDELSLRGRHFLY